MKNIYGIFFLLVILSVNAGATSVEKAQKDLKNFFEKFDKNSVQAMSTIPLKTGAESVLQFNPDQITTGEFVLLKDRLRQMQCHTTPGSDCRTISLADRAPINSTNNPDAILFGNTSAKNIYYFEQRGIRSGQVRAQPWSGSYWPMYAGGAAARYGSASFPESASYQEHLRFRNSYNFGSASNLDELSPAEKYDLYLGDLNFTFSRAQWSMAARYAQNTGEIESWIGFCHGWAPAAYQDPRPLHTVQVPLRDGRSITFYPNDIKALATLAWGQSASVQINIGGRCSIAHPAVDNVGRIIDPNCWDANPGSWHMAVLNTMGVNGRSFVMDATYDYQVWNQPVKSFQIYYFNPVDRQIRQNIQDAMVPRQYFNNDVFARYRSPYASFIVGVTMEVSYMQEIRPRLVAEDGPQNDRSTTVIYQYDLELDNQGNILGGEWYQNAHPDFVWTIGNNSSPMADYESSVSTGWNGMTAVPADWSRAASLSSQRSQPLYRVVRNLIQLAQ